MNSNSLNALALQRLKKDFWGVFSFCVILAFGFLGLLAYVIAPDNSEHANQMHLAVHSKPPGFKVKMLNVPNQFKSNQHNLSKWFLGEKYPDKTVPLRDYEFTEDSLLYLEYGTPLDTLLYKKMTIEAFNDVDRKKLVIDKVFYLGTDKYGRDMLSRLLVGARISFSIGFVAVLISLIVGLFMGSVSGYYGGKVDALIMWIINVTWSIPTLLMVIAITLALGKGFWQVFIAVGLTMWVEVARVVRGQVMSVKEMQYVTAARALGFNDLRIIVNHILPNIMAPVIVICASNFAAAILIESGLSFLGIGAQPPVSSWGAMIKNHYNYIILGKPYLAIAPGVCIMLLVMSFMLLGNALRTALDVRR
mgnify:CR=1 FL=1